MIGTGAKQRSRKRRRLAAIVYASQRLDAVFPEVSDCDLQFVQLILLTYLVHQNSIVRRVHRGKLARQFRPDLKLRADDIDFVAAHLSNIERSSEQIRWLCEFMVSSFPEGSSSSLFDKMEIFTTTEHIFLPRQQMIIECLDNLGSRLT